MRFNVKATATQFTHEGAPSTPLKPMDALRRSVMAHMLWEDSFYEDGQDVAKRIEELCGQVSAMELGQLITEVHKKGLLRHVPLFLTTHLLKKKDNHAAGVVEAICTRPDQMTELLALYWKDGRKPLAKQLKKGLAKAFVRFDEYQLSKWNRDNKIKLRDVMFMVHPKPIYDNQPDMWKRLINNELKTADTWETRLSAGADKKQSFEELLTQDKMGLLAILMNVRNMHESGVPKALVKATLEKKAPRTPMLPFKFLAAARACPLWEDIIDEAMIASVSLKPKFPGKTYVFVDVSGSMLQGIAGKSQLNYMDAACAFAIMLRECCEEVDILSFSNQLVKIVPRRGMALAEAIKRSQANSGTDLCAALNTFMMHHKEPKFDRLIVITDEQINRALPKINSTRKYILNVAAYKNGIGTQDQWLTVSGFSEASLDYIREIENESKI